MKKKSKRRDPVALLEALFGRGKAHPRQIEPVQAGERLRHYTPITKQHPETRALLRQRLDEAMARLTPREREIVQSRYNKDVEKSKYVLRDGKVVRE